MERKINYFILFIFYLYLFILASTSALFRHAKVQMLNLEIKKLRRNGLRSLKKQTIQEDQS